MGEWSGQFREAIDNAQPHFISYLHLNHFGSEVLSDPLGIFELELHLSTTLLHKMVEQKRSQTLKLVIGRMLAQVENLRHSLASLRQRKSESPLSLMSEAFHNAPKGGYQAYLAQIYRMESVGNALLAL